MKHVIVVFLFVYIEQTDLGNRLLPAFNSPSGIPYSDVNLGTAVAHSPRWSPDSSTSEVTTIQLEFRDLTYLTKNKTYERVSNYSAKCGYAHSSNYVYSIHQAAERVNDLVHNLDKKSGLAPIQINANTGQFRSFSTITLGARGDSYYEYLLKQWLQTGKRKND